MPPAAGPPVAGARRVALSSLIQAGGEVGSRIGMLLLYSVMAREVTRAAFGDFVSGASLALLVFVAAFGLDFTTMKTVARNDGRAGEAFWNSLVLKTLLGSVALGAVVAVALVGGYSSRAIAATALLGAASLIDMAAMSMHAVFRGIERTGPVAQGQLVQRYATAAMGGAALLTGSGIVVVAALWVGGSVLGLVYVLWRGHRLGVIPRGSISPRSARALLGESFGLGVSSLFGAALSRLDVIVLGLMKPAAVVALYGAAYRTFEVTLIVMTTFGLATFPVLARIGPDDPVRMGDAFGRMLKVVLAVTAPIVVLLIVVAGPLTRGLYGSGFSAAPSVLQLLAPAVTLTGIFGLSCNVLAAQGRQKAIMGSLVLGAAVNAGMNLALIPAHGANGAALAMTASMLLTSVVLVGVVRRQTGPVHFLRSALGPVIATAAAAGVGLALRGGAGALAVGATYVVVLVLAEWRAYPGDVDLVRQMVRRQRAVT